MTHAPPGADAGTGGADHTDDPDGRSRTDGPTDAALLAAHVAGDPDAFATLVARHRDRL